MQDQSFSEIAEHRKAPELIARIQRIVPKLQGWCPLEKAMVMATYIYQRKPSLVVELGIFGGRSLIPMAMAVQCNGKGKAIGIDPWCKEAVVEGENAKANDEWWTNIDLEQVYINFVNTVLALNLSSVCFWQRMKSDEAIKNFRDSTIDMLHCDSNHSQQVSLNEIDQWSPKVAVGGLWIMDDADWDTMQKAKEYILDRGFQLKKDYVKWAVYEKIH